MSEVILFNPRSAKSKHRIPNSILQIGASIEGKYDYVFVDGNLESDAWVKLKDILSKGNTKYFGCTVMPGLQLKQAISFTKQIRNEIPGVINIWGGYFPANQYHSVLNSDYVDYIINGPGDVAFPSLLDALGSGDDPKSIKNLIFKKSGQTVITEKEALLDQDSLPLLPYKKLNEFYQIKNYLGKTFLGNKTAAYHSSMGCPFTCSFCAVVPIYEARWKGKSAEKVYEDVKFLKDKFGADAVEFHDNNFFVSENRTVEFAELIEDEKINWWGEGRIDTIDKYSDETLKLMKAAGCKMIFFGAESSNDSVLKQMDKGGTQTGEQIKRFAARMKKFDIIPEYSFVLGLPADSSKKILAQIDSDIQFIREIKKINPLTEIIIYVYSPVPTESSELYNEVSQKGFKFPEKLEDWISTEWENFDLRKNPLTPWLNPKMVKRIQNFETVLNAYYPTISDFKLTSFQKKVMRALSSFRYKNELYLLPYELKIPQKFWLKYRQPEVEGFYTE
ncbi:MAG: radical SAM protein [Ignavibacterium sp.]|nr:MAG: radical SAM protein [Ignavibacterium sp.]